MRIFYYFGKSYSAFFLNDFSKIKNPDVIVLGGGVIDDVNFEDELSDNTKISKELAGLSKFFNCVVIAVCGTIIYDNVFNSVLVFEKGKLLGICDEITENENIASGAAINLYDFEFGRLCILLNENASQIEFFQLAAAYDAVIVFSINNDSNLRLINSANYYASNKLSLNCICFSKNKMQVFNSVNHEKIGKNMIFSEICVKKLKNNQKFFKHIHNLIYTKLS